MMSKSFAASMNRNVTATRMIGASSGSVTKKNDWRGFAPSISAAS